MCPGRGRLEDCTIKVLGRVLHDTEIEQNFDSFWMHGAIYVWDMLGHGDAQVETPLPVSELDLSSPPAHRLGIK